MTGHTGTKLNSGPVGCRQDDANYNYLISILPQLPACNRERDISELPGPTKSFTSAEQCMLFASLREYLYHQSRDTFARAMVLKIFHACFPAPR